MTLTERLELLENTFALRPELDEDGRSLAVILGIVEDDKEAEVEQQKGEKI